MKNFVFSFILRGEQKGKSSTGYNICSTYGN